MKALMSSGLVIALACGASFGDGVCVAPEIVGSHETSSFFVGANELHVDGTMAYVFSPVGGVDYFDVSVPESPVLMATVFPDVPGPYIFAFGYALSGETMFMGIDGIGFQGIWAADVSDPTSPVTLGTLNVGENGKLVAVGDVLYTRYGGQGGGEGSGFRAFDVSDPGAMTLLSETLTPGVMMDFEVVGTLLYAADGASGLRIYDVSDPANPVALGVYSEPDFLAREVEVDGSSAYVNGGRRLTNVNVFNPMSPYRDTWVAFAEPSDQADTLGNALSVSGSNVYAMNGTREMLVFRGDYLNPRGSMQFDRPIGDVAVVDDYAYFANNDFTEGLLIADVSVPCNPCLPDMNDDGALDFFDVSAYLHFFAAQDPRADVNGPIPGCPDGDFDFHDVAYFLGLFGGGCP